MKSKYVAAAVALSLAIAGQTQAVITNWTVQSASSSLTMSGNLSSGGVFIASVSPQGPGSLTATYSGTITSTTTLTGGIPQDISLQLSTLTAGISGNWEPLPNSLPGTFPANYGMDVNLEFLGGAYFAIRNLTLDLQSASTALSGAPFSLQTFDASIDVDMLGVASYRNYGVVGGFEPIGEVPFDPDPSSFLSSGNISYGSGGLAGVATLTLPVDFTLAFLTAGSDTTATNDDIGLYFDFTGQIVATAPTASVPEASSLALLGLAGSIIGFVGYRRKRA